MRKLFTFLLLILSTAIHAQTIMTVGDESVDVKEYKRIYEKNVSKNQEDAYTKQKLDEFTDLYSLFLMKLQEARSQKLDTTATFKNEVAMYKGQLANKYNNDDEYLDKLAQEEYEREKSEWNISHILLKTPRSGILDTAATIKQLNDIKTELKKGTITFEEAAKLYSQDDFSKNTGGKIGWVTAMQTPYTLETAFVNTAKGDISEPAFSVYGAHIIKVNDKRPNFGTIKVSQILIHAYKADKDIQEKAKSKADAVYQEIKGGKITFEDAVKKYSQDEYSNQNNGELPWFGPGQNVDDFENKALAMKIGEVSEPIYTTYGYHIIRKDAQKPLVPYSERADLLKKSIMNSDRGKVAKAKASEEMREKLRVKENQQGFFEALSHMDSSDFAKNKIAPQDRDVVVFSVEDEEVTFGQVVEVAHKNANGRGINDHVAFIKNYYVAALNNVAKKHEIDYLLANNPEFANLLNDYEDGILIFALMEKNVWNKASQDTLGQMKYYEGHKDKYTWKNAVEYDLYTANDRETLTKLSTTLKNINSVPEEAVAIVKESLPNANLTFKYKKQEISTLDPQIVAKLSANQNSSIIEQGGVFEYYVPIKYSPTPTPKTFAEARSFVLSDYQAQLDQEWNEQLKRKYPVKVNPEIYESLYNK